MTEVKMICWFTAFGLTYLVIGADFAALLSGLFGVAFFGIFIVGRIIEPKGLK